MSKIKSDNEIELSSESIEASSSSTEEDAYFESTEVISNDRSPNTIKKFINTIIFRMAMKQIMKGRKGNLTVKDMNPVSKNLNVEDEVEYYKSEWKKQSLNKNPSIGKVILKREWKRFLFMYLMVAIYDLFSIAFPLECQFITKWLNKEDAPKSTGILFIFLTFCFQMIACSSSECAKKFMFTTSLRIRNGLIGVIYEKALKLNAAGIAEPGRLVNLMSNDSSTFLSNLEYFMTGIASPPMFIVLYSFMGYYVGKWVYVPLVVLAFFLIVNLCYGRVNTFFYNKFVASKDKRLSFFNEILRNIKFIKYNRWEKPLEDKVNKYRNWEIVFLYFTGFFRAMFFTFTIDVGPMMAVLMFVAMVYSEAAITLPIVVTSIALFNSIRIPIRTVGIGMANITCLNVSLKRINKFLTTPELVPITSTASKSEYAVEMSRVNYSFPNNETAFACDELKIKKGELVCVLGSVGGGKSSFLLSLLNELEKTQGDTVINGKITYTSQTPWMMNASVRENICFLTSYDKKQYQSAVYDACLATDIDSLVGGDAYVIAEKGANLSGGQRQRVNIARALYDPKDIILLDDPLSAVDFKVGTYIFENAIQKHLAKKTRIVVTNQTYFLEKADRILVIDKNQMVFNGSLEELKKSNIPASQFVKTLSKKIQKEEEQEEEIITSDASGTKTREETREIGRVPLHVYWQYIKSGSLLMFFIMWLCLAGRICALYYYNTYLTKWGKSIRPLKGAPQGDKGLFNIFAYSFVGDIAGIFLTEEAIILFCLIVSVRLHKNLIHKLLKCKLGFFDVTPMGRIINYFSRDFQNVDFTIPPTSEPLIVNITTIVIVAITICKASIYLVILVLVIAIIFVCLYIFVSKPIIELQRLEGITRAPIFVHYDQTLLGLSTIRSSNGQEQFKDKLIEKIKNNTTSLYLTKMAKYWMLQRMDWLGVFICFVTVTVLVITKLQKSMEPSLAGTALTNICNIPSTVNVFAMSIIEIETNMQSTERVLQLKKLRAEESENVKEKYHNPPSSWPSTGSVEFSDFKFRYRRGLPMVLKGINATILPKEKIGVVGRTGSGKSTLMAGLFRIEEAYSGKIKVDGIDISTIPLDILRKQMCILPQEATLFSGTVRDNLDPWNQMDDDKLRKVLLMVESTNQLDDVVTEGGDNFSLGQRQLVCLARALLKGSKILIMDEATANIDIQTDKNIQEMVRRNFDDITVITVAHRLQTIMDSNKVMVFDKGKLKEMDTPLNLIKEKDTLFNGLVQQSGCAEELRRLAQKNEPNASLSPSPTMSPAEGDTSTSLSPKIEVNLLTNDSTRASPIQFQETVERNQSEQKLIPSPSLDKSTDSTSPTE
ncbi:canalicular multispecific organic anion transporter, putative [Entamoeba invadens IP1]|uniref:Canalicular multispecific organic anion transporter, putative n=1 Tax=Entamoeba invadens IP1 TaxID=370355 RepID=A0A0A1TVJ3_ENTIV|nr:canalicular multispecific organic anion transporter, putative [Entamoeba invadens IP1]ELP84449.1 canalicular multispecific organic anion transporter, putative [Entamoeba invadens IP1]|eukprot:XP_004183795.1 canalicular multispecific organic anion transporter, putative [Entamoeba invadens IP1]